MAGKPACAGLELGPRQGRPGHLIRNHTTDAISISWEGWVITQLYNWEFVPTPAILGGADFKCTHISFCMTTPWKRRLVKTNRRQLSLLDDVSDVGDIYMYIIMDLEKCPLFSGSANSLSIMGENLQWQSVGFCNMQNGLNKWAWEITAGKVGILICGVFLLVLKKNHHLPIAELFLQPFPMDILEREPCPWSWWCLERCTQKQPYLVHWTLIIIRHQVV